MAAKIVHLIAEIAGIQNFDPYIYIYSGGPNNMRGSFFDATRDPIFLGVSLFMEAIRVASIDDLMGSQ